jgi:hypothetical protein
LQRLPGCGLYLIQKSYSITLVNNLTGTKMSDPLIIAAIVCGILSIFFLWAGIAAGRKRKVLGAARNFTFTLLMLVLAL